MKIKILIVTAFLIGAHAYAQLPPIILAEEAPKAESTHLKYTSTDFAGRWHGDENCSKISTPDAVLTIKSDGADKVIIMGFYASNGSIKGTLDGNTVNIPSQTVPDFDFNITVEGTLVISSDRQLLNSNVTIVNNGLKDVCSNSYTH